MDEALMDAFLHQHNLGNKVNGSFTTKAHENMVNELKEKLGKYVDKDKVKNRIKTLKANLSKSHDFFKNLSGFSWNPVTKLWSAKPEVWDALIKVNKDAKEWMTKPVLHYDIFVILFGNDRATSENSETTKELKKKQSSNMIMSLIIPLRKWIIWCHRIKYLWMVLILSWRSFKCAN
ncbi:hypothetical protein SLE2022_100590 [Rubroshorea leprosula]